MIHVPFQFRMILFKISFKCLKWFHINFSTEREIKIAFIWNILVWLIIFISSCERTKRIWVLCLSHQFLLFFLKWLFKKFHCSIDRFYMSWRFSLLRLPLFGPFVLNLHDRWRNLCGWTLAWTFPLFNTASLTSSKLFWSLRRFRLSFLCRVFNKSFILC